MSSLKSFLDEVEVVIEKLNQGSLVVGRRIILKVDELSQAGDEIALSVGVHISLRCTPMKVIRGVEELHDAAVLKVELAIEVHAKV